MKLRTAQSGERARSRRLYRFASQTSDTAVNDSRTFSSIAPDEADESNQYHGDELPWSDVRRVRRERHGE